MFRNMYRLSTLIAALTLVIAQSASAAGLPRDGKSSTEGFFRPSAPWIMDLDAGVMLGSGITAPGIDMMIHARLNTDIRMFLGGEVGLFLQTSGGTNLIIPVLANYTMEFDTTPTFHPTIGASVGVSFLTGGGSTASFTFLANPGARFDIGQNSELDVKFRLGVISSTFVVIPQVGLAFAI